MHLPRGLSSPTFVVTTLLFSYMEAWGQTVLAQQGFEPTGTTWAIIAGNSFIADSVGTSDTPANQRIRTGAFSWQVTNTPATLELANVPTVGYSALLIRLYVSSPSKNATNGSDGGDSLRIFVALNGSGFSSTSTVTIHGNTNARWGYTANLTATGTAGVYTKYQAPQGGTNTNNYSKVEIAVPDGTSSVALKIVANNDHANELWCVDDITLTGTAAPTITLSTASLSFGGVAIGSTSAEQSYTVTGSHLLDDLTIFAPSAFEISTTSGSGFGNSITLHHVAGSVPTTTIYVRFTPTEQQTYSGVITHSSSSAATMSLAVSGTGVQPPRYVRSVQSGDWNAPTTWQSSLDGIAWSSAAVPPSANDVQITIRDQHTVTISAPVTASNVVVEGGGILEATALWTATNFTLRNGGTYIHNADGSSPNGSALDFPGASRVFEPSSTVIFKKWANGGTSPTALPDGILWGNLTIDVATLAGSWNQLGRLTSILGNLTILNTGGTTREFRLSSNTAYTLTIGGDLMLRGGVLNLTNGTGTASSPMDIHLGGSYIQTGGTLTQTATNHISLLKFTGGTPAVQFTHTGGTLTSTKINFEVSAGKQLSLSNNLSLGTGRTLTVAGALLCGTSLISGSGSFILADGATLGIGTPAGITLSGPTGNIQVAGVRTFSSQANFVYNGTSPQESGTGLPATVSGLIIDNPAGVVLSQPVEVTTSLILHSGVLNAGVHTLTVGSAASVTRAAGFVEGKLRKSIGSGTVKTPLFEVGSGAGYAPVEIVLSNVTQPGMLTVESVAGTHPAIGSSGLDPRRSVKRYWSLLANGLSYERYAATFSFPSADIDAGANPTLFIVRRLDAGVWKSTTPGTKHSTSVQIVHETAMGDFAVGEPAKPPSAITIVSGNNQTGPIYSTVPLPIVARVTNSDGDPVQGQAVTIGLVTVPFNQLGAAVTVQRAVTDVQGLVSTLLVLGSKVGTYVGSFTIQGLNLSPAIFQATATAGLPTFMTLLSGSGQVGSVASALPVPLAVLVTDMGGNPVSGVSVAFTIAAAPEGATGQSVSSTSAITNSAGQASTILRLGNRAGQYVVRASSVGLSGSPVTFIATATSLTRVESFCTVPSNFVLYPSYPNPFNLNTTIRFGLPQESAVRLVVYNMLGVPVRTMIDGEFLGAAYYQVRWDGRDDAGQSVSSGVYLYRMTAGSFQATKRMTLLK